MGYDIRDAMFVGYDKLLCSWVMMLGMLCSWVMTLVECYVCRLGMGSVSYNGHTKAQVIVALLSQYSRFGRYFPSDSLK